MLNSSIIHKRKNLNELNFRITENKTYAIVGKSESDKSTIFHLLCKMYTTKKEEIFIDDIDIKWLDEQSIRGNITIINAHRFSTIQNCNRIYFLEKAKIIVSGTHKELLEKCSSYQNLCESEIQEVCSNKSYYYSNNKCAYSTLSS